MGVSKQKPDTQKRFLDPEIQESSTYLAVKVMGLSKQNAGKTKTGAES